MRFVKRFDCDFGLIEATRLELSEFFPSEVTERLPEGRRLYTFGTPKTSRYGDPGCPIWQAGLWPDNDNVNHELTEAYSAFDRFCVKVLEPSRETVMA